jgi:putative component of toxin-antitoxin plasmid stabilization module
MQKSIVLAKRKAAQDESCIVEGRCHRIESLRSATGRYEAKEFLNSLARNLHEKMFSRLDRIANEGLPKNTEQYRMVGDGLGEVKIQGVRLFVFRDGDRLIVATHGMKKQGNDKTQDREIRRAKELMRGYFKERAK